MEPAMQNIISMIPFADTLISAAHRFVPGAEERRVLERLRTFASLPSGWDNGHGEPVCARCLEVAPSVVRAFFRVGVSADCHPSVDRVLVSGSDGPLLMEAWISDEAEADLGVEADGDHLLGFTGTTKIVTFGLCAVVRLHRSGKLRESLSTIVDRVCHLGADVHYP